MADAVPAPDQNLHGLVVHADDVEDVNAAQVYAAAHDISNFFVGQLSEDDMATLRDEEMSMNSKFSYFFNNADADYMSQRVGAIVENIAYVGFNAEQVFNDVCHMEQNFFVLLEDMIILITFGLTLGTNMTKILDAMAPALRLQLLQVRAKYGIVDNKTVQNCVTINRLMQSFAPLTVMIANLDTVPMPFVPDIEENGVQYAFPKACRTSALLALLPNNMNNNLRTALTKTILFYQVNFSQLTAPRPNAKYKRATAKALGYVRAVQPTFFEISNQEKLDLLASMGISLENLELFQAFATRITNLVATNAPIVPPVGAEGMDVLFPAETD